MGLTETPVGHQSLSLWTNQQTTYDKHIFLLTKPSVFLLIRWSQTPTLIISCRDNTSGVFILTHHGLVNRASRTHDQCAAAGAPAGKHDCLHLKDHLLGFLYSWSRVSQPQGQGPHSGSFGMVRLEAKRDEQTLLGELCL